MWDRHQALRRQADVEYDPDTWFLIEQGRAIDDEQYEALLRDQEAAKVMARRDLPESHVDVLILPLDPLMALPMGLATNGAALAVQLWAGPGGGTLLIQAGRLVEELVGPLPAPGIKEMGG